jgi:hypothetical protein
MENNPVVGRLNERFQGIRELESAATFITELNSAIEAARDQLRPLDAVIPVLRREAENAVENTRLLEEAQRELESLNKSEIWLSSNFNPRTGQNKYEVDSALQVADNWISTNFAPPTTSRKLSETTTTGSRVLDEESKTAYVSMADDWLKRLGVDKKADPKLIENVKKFRAEVLSGAFSKSSLELLIEQMKEAAKLRIEDSLEIGALGFTKTLSLVSTASESSFDSAAKYADSALSKMVDLIEKAGGDATAFTTSIEGFLSGVTPITAEMDEVTAATTGLRNNSKLIEAFKAIAESDLASPKIKSYVNDIVQNMESVAADASAKVVASINKQRRDLSVQAVNELIGVSATPDTEAGKLRTAMLFQRANQFVPDKATKGLPTDVANPQLRKLLSGSSSGFGSVENSVALADYNKKFSLEKLADQETGQQISALFDEAQQATKERRIEIESEINVLLSLQETYLNTAEAAERYAESIRGKGNPLTSFTDGFGSAVSMWRATAQNFTNIGKSLADGLNSSLGDAFSGFILGTKSAKEAFADFGRSMLEMATKMLAQQAMQMLLGGLFGGFGKLFAAPVAASFSAGAPADYAAMGSANGGLIRKYANGGLVGGPVNPFVRKDDQLVALQSGEFVIPADATSHFGPGHFAPYLSKQMPQAALSPVSKPGSMSIANTNQQTTQVKVDIHNYGDGKQEATSSQQGGGEAFGRSLAAFVQQQNLESLRQGGILKAQRVQR